MGAESSTDIAYGVAIDLGALEWWEIGEAHLQDGKIFLLGVGRYGGPKRWFLALTDTTESVESGDVKVIQPYRAADEPYLTWDALLVAAAEKLKVSLDGQPGWIFALDES